MVWLIVWNRIEVMRLLLEVGLWLEAGGLSGAESTVSRTASFVLSLFGRCVHVQTEGLLRVIGRHSGVLLMVTEFGYRVRLLISTVDEQRRKLTGQRW